MLGRANYRLEEREARLEEVEANLEAGQSKLGEDFGSGLEVVDLKERVEKLEGELQGKRELLKEQKVKAEEAKVQASNLQCQLDEMRGATSVDDSALEQELMCWLAETGSQEGSSWRISRYLNHLGSFHRQYFSPAGERGKASPSQRAGSREG